MPIDCTPNGIATASKCYCGFSRTESDAAAIWSLCQWANAEPSTQFSYEPETELIQWIDSAGPHVGNLAAFYATPTWPSTTSIDSTFTNITVFHNVSTLLSLTTLSLSDGHLVGVADFSNCLNLVTLDCSDQNGLITGLNVSGCTSLSTLDCSANAALVALDITGCMALTHLDCALCGLSSLDVSLRNLLNYLNCSDNQLGTLDITGCFALVNLFTFNEPALVVVGP